FFPLIERMFSYPMERREFQKKNGYRLKLKNPQTMNEKIVVKKVRDRNPLLPLTADKFHVKGLLRQTFGTVWTEQHIIPTLDYGTQFKTVSLADLPEEFIVKGTHLSGRNLIKTRVSNITQIELDNHIKKIITMNSYIAKYSLDLLLSRCYEMNQITFLKILNLYVYMERCN